MMKKILVLMVAAMFLVAGVAPEVFAQVAGPSGSATVTVPPYLEFSMRIVKRMDSDAGQTNPWTQGTDISTSPSFNFGTLRPVNDSTGKLLYMRGQYYYAVLMIASTSGRRYRITQTGTQLSGSGATIPRESVLLIPGYQWDDELLVGTPQGAPPSGAVVGPVTSACLGTPQLVYEDNGSGLGRIVRAFIAISGPGSGADWPSNYTLGTNGSAGQGTLQEYTDWRPITKDQVSGTYGSSTISFTLTLIS